jgi:hypothetical protein
MIKYLFALLLLLHGLIHFMGFAKAFGYGNISALTKYISKNQGMLWFLVGILFIVTTLLYLLKKESWPIVAIIAAILSQLLILMVWKDAKFGTVANVIILVVAIACNAAKHFEVRFKNDVLLNLQRSNRIHTDILTEADLTSLPSPVKQYLRYCGVVNKPKVKNARIVFEGEMRDRGKKWFPFRSVQYNFFDEPARLFFMKAKLFGFTVPGYHRYQDAKASMQVKLFGLFNMLKAKGAEMNMAETVTLFNDMCLLAPATLIEKRIEWTAIDDVSAKAIFTIAANKISAILYFNEQGQLINFISDDRYAISDMKQYRFSTPVKKYTHSNDRKLLSYGEASWHYPDGPFVYGKFNMKHIEYNVAAFEQ